MDMREAILDAAESRMRQGGYHGFSFRDLAADVGVKSASVHYHFPTKADLGAAAAERYLARLLARLGDAADSRPAAEKLDAMRLVFRDALVRDGRMCLCGALGAEIASLPPMVALPTRGFFVACLAWLETALSGLGEEQAGRRARHLLALLEGALLLARTLDDVAAFDAAMQSDCLAA